MKIRAFGTKENRNKCKCEPSVTIKTFFPKYLWLSDFIECNKLLFAIRSPSFTCFVLANQLYIIINVFIILKLMDPLVTKPPRTIKGSKFS